MERITCRKCGEQAFATEPFCPACGTVFGRGEADESDESMPKVGFDTPVAHALTDALLAILAGQIQKGERVLVSLQNEEGNVGFAATNRRILVLRASGLAGAYGGAACRELPYLSIDEVKYQSVGALGQLQFMVRTIGGKPEVGVRGRMGKVVPEKLAGMPSDKLIPVVEALRQLVAKAEAMQQSAT